MERSAKRKATEQLDSDKFKKEEAEEEEEQPKSVGGTWQRASEDILQKRKVVKAKRKGANTPPKEASDPAKAPVSDKLPSFWVPSETMGFKDTSANFGFSWPPSDTKKEDKPTETKEAEKEKPSTSSSDFKWSFATPTETKEAEKEKPSAASSDFKWSFSTAPALSTETKEAEKEKSSSEFKWSFSPTSTMPSFSQKYDYVPPATASSVAKWPSFSISDNFSFGTSSSNWPSFSTPTKDNQSKGEGEESGPESGANTPNTFSPSEKEKPTLPPLEAVKTGEEDETTVAEARVRLYEFLKEEKSWKERCTGTLKINVDKSNKYRILMRTDNALRVVLNALPFAGMKIEKPNKQQIKFTCMNATTQPIKLANLWVKIPSVQDTEKLYDALEKCKNSKADK